MAKLEIKTAKIFQPFLQPAPYKGAAGGRGSGKSHYFGESLIEDCLAEPGNFGTGMYAVCIREVQKDLAQSSKLLIEKKLEAMRISEKDGFKVFRDVIKTPKDGIIIFKGMNDYNSDSIKSLEGFKRCWNEEAQTTSNRTLEILTPTFRDKNAELWFSWNPTRKNDAVDVLFRKNLPTGGKFVFANWRDNPWFNETRLPQERLDCLKNNPDQYEHIWEGGYVSVISGAYFSKQIIEAKAQQRIGLSVAKDKIQPFRAFIDIGGTGARADAFCIWMAQFVGKEIRIVDYYEAIGQEFPDHVRWLNANGYGDAEIILPHDGINHDRLQRVTYESAFRDAGFRRVYIVENQGVGAAMARIEAVRRIFPQCWFDIKTEPGTDALGWYHPRIDEKRQYDQGPEHDWSSHASDAFGLLAIYYETEFKPRQVKRTTLDYTHIDRGIV